MNTASMACRSPRSLVQLDAAVLSDDYVLQSYGGFFTGAFVGTGGVDYAGYGTRLSFISSSIRSWAIG